MIRKIFSYACCLLLLLLPALAAAQHAKATLSGIIKDQRNKTPLSFVTVSMQTARDSSFFIGTITDEAGRFVLPDVPSGTYVLSVSLMGYQPATQRVMVGKLSPYLDLGGIEMAEDALAVEEVVVTSRADEVAGKMDKKTFDVAANISQGGGSVLQAMRNLPGVTTDQNGKVQLRGSDKVAILIDGQQTALTGFGNQAGLDNIPASAIEKIEIINNPSAKYDANGNAGIINIIYKKNNQAGFNGKLGLTAGAGALWEKRENLPTIRPQYRWTPKLNPSLSLNERKNKYNAFFQGDVLAQKALNKNEFITRSYDDGSIIEQQFLENRSQLAFTLKSGIDWYVNDRNTLTFSTLYNREGHVDRGDLPYFDAELLNRRRLWLYYEDEVNTAVNASAVYLHKFKQPGHRLTTNVNYTFHREDEKFYFSNVLPALTNYDTTKLIADENVSDLNLDYVRPLRHGRIEAGTKLRWRYIPTEMIFIPGANSILDLGAAGGADYNEIITALYGNYVFESKYFEVEAGLRLEAVQVDYEVKPGHNTYQSDGYDYLQPFPNLRLGWLLSDRHKLSLFYNRRVDRPDEYDLRIFPKYDDPEVLKTGNPTVRPQYTQTLELGYKTTWGDGYFYSALYHRMIDDILTRILTTSGGGFINSISQNAGKGRNSGLEVVFSQEVSPTFSFNLSLNGYQNTIDAYRVENTYPVNVALDFAQQQNYSGNVKGNAIFKLPRALDVQVTGVYLAPDLVPQGKIAARYSVDLGVKKALQRGKGELFLNATDLFNTMRIQKDIQGDGFRFVSTDLYETQVLRIGYGYQF